MKAQPRSQCTVSCIIFALLKQFSFYLVLLIFECLKLQLFENGRIVFDINDSKWTDGLRADIFPTSLQSVSTPRTISLRNLNN
jgi:hypothetical protein